MRAPIDSLLAIVVQQAANELRLGTDRAPKMFARGTPKKLAIPETSDEMVRHLLGPLLSHAREAALRESGRVELTYDAPSLGAFHVLLTTRAGDPGFDAVFTRAAPPLAAVAAPAPPPVAAPPASHPRVVAAAPAVAPVAPPPLEGELAALLARAVELRASDVHLLSCEVPAVRVDGRLRRLEAEPAANPEALLGDLLGPEQRARLDSGCSVDLALDVAGSRFRLNVYRASEGLAVAARLLARAAPALASLGLGVALDDLADLPHGLVIVCGPTGSGKSTTLAALVQEALRRRAPLVVSLEDPIEYVLGGHAGLVRQRQIGRDVKDFAQGLRDALREDPDVLLIGEMRDPESISLALTAAETGHLVLTSLHSRSAPSAVERIVDVYPPARQQQVRGQLADSLRAVVSQRLLPRRGGGRVAALEVMRVTYGVASTIREGKTAQLASAIQSGKKEGMVPLERSLSDLVRAGHVSQEAARAVVNDPAMFEHYIRG